MQNVFIQQTFIIHLLRTRYLQLGIYTVLVIIINK